MKRYGTIEKNLGETPLEALHRFRARESIAQDVPLAYAGRLDPMASGMLLVLIGDECKRQERYHALDKAYEFKILFGVGADTADVLGIIKHQEPVTIDREELRTALRSLVGEITLPYPHFSSKTVQGKPLLVWTLEGRLHEIEIPVKTSRLHSLTCTEVLSVTGAEIYEEISRNIETVTIVTAKSKALGKDFRRDDVRASWRAFLDAHAKDIFSLATCTCICSSGTYMRTLAEEIAGRLNVHGLAFSIKRTRIGRYRHIGILGIWSKTFR
jgi:tRNA pseudouridine55 synthase